MWRFPVGLIALALSSSPATSPTATWSPAAAESVVGRWDITIAGPDRPLPSWLEGRPSGNGYLVGQFGGGVGRARPVARVDLADRVMRFSIPPQWEQGKADLQVEGRLDGAGLRGTMTFPDGTRREWTAVRAPSLRRDKAPSWGAPIQLFNGKDVTGWHALGTNQWRVVNGVLQ